MKYIAIVSVLLLLLVILPVGAGDLDPIGDINETPLEKIVPVVYTEKVTKTTTIIDVFLELIGWKTETVEVVQNEIIVEIDGWTVGVIPNNSKFVGIVIHEICIPHQYGTDLWYACEVSL